MAGQFKHATTMFTRLAVCSRCQVRKKYRKMTRQQWRLLCFSLTLGWKTLR